MRELAIFSDKSVGLFLNPSVGCFLAGQQQSSIKKNATSFEIVQALVMDVRDGGAPTSKARSCVSVNMYVCTICHAELEHPLYPCCFWVKRAKNNIFTDPTWTADICMYFLITSKYNSVRYTLIKKKKYLRAVAQLCTIQNALIPHEM